MKDFAAGSVGGKAIDEAVRSGLANIIRNCALKNEAFFLKYMYIDAEII